MKNEISEIRTPIALIASWIAITWIGILSFGCNSQPAVTECICGNHSIETTEFVDDEPVIETASKRRIRGVWFDGKAPRGMTAAKFQSDCMRGLAQLSSFTNTDFRQQASSSGAFIRVFVFTRKEFEDRWPDIKKSKLYPLARQQGNSMWFAEDPRYAGDIVPPVMIHETGHRYNLQHVTDTTSIMHPHLISKTMNAQDRAKFLQRMGKPR